MSAIDAGSNAVILSSAFKEYQAKVPERAAEISEPHKQILLQNLDNKTRATAESALRQIRCIPFKEFLQGLEGATDNLCQQMAPSEKFVVLYDPIIG